MYDVVIVGGGVGRRCAVIFPRASSRCVRPHPRSGGRGRNRRAHVRAVALLGRAAVAPAPAAAPAPSRPHSAPWSSTRRWPTPCGRSSRRLCAWERSRCARAQAWPLSVRRLRSSLSTRPPTAALASRASRSATARGCACGSSWASTAARAPCARLRAAARAAATTARSASSSTSCVASAARGGAAATVFQRFLPDELLALLPLWGPFASVVWST